jgi:hypothetical protein
MKYAANLNHHENLLAWEKHYEKTPRTQYCDLTIQEKNWLGELNLRLRNLEDKFSPILHAKFKELKMREAEKSDWLEEFNLGYRLTFYLREDDFEFDENDDNILMQIEAGIFKYSEKLDWGFGATQVDHGEAGEYFGDGCHCYLYHQLYDHCYLDWKDLFRIGALYMEVIIEEQSGMLLLNV